MSGCRFAYGEWVSLRHPLTRSPSIEPRRPLLVAPPSGEQPGQWQFTGQAPDLREGVRVTLRWARRITVTLGALAGAGGGAAVWAAGLVAATATGILGAALGAGALVGAWRLSYRNALAKTELELTSLLEQVAARLQRDASYSLPPNDGKGPSGP